MGKISRMKSGLLNRGHELYKILKGEKAPTWWNSLKEDKDIYQGRRSIIPTPNL